MTMVVLMMLVVGMKIWSWYGSGGSGGDDDDDDDDEEDDVYKMTVKWWL